MYRIGGGPDSTRKISLKTHEDKKAKAQSAEPEVSSECYELERNPTAEELETLRLQDQMAKTSIFKFDNLTQKEPSQKEAPAPLATFKEDSLGPTIAKTSKPSSLVEGKETDKEAFSDIKGTDEIIFPENSTISVHEKTRFIALREQVRGSKKEKFVRNMILDGMSEEIFGFLEDLTEKTASEDVFKEMGYRQGRTRRGSVPLEVQFQQDVKLFKSELENEVAFVLGVEPELARSIGVSEVDQQIMQFIANQSGADFDGKSIRDKITTCFSLCDRQYKENGIIPEQFQPLVDLLKCDMDSEFIKSYSRTSSTLTTTHNGVEYLRKSGLHEFVKVEHRVENFLMSIGQHPTKTLGSDYIPHLETVVEGSRIKLSFNDVYESLQVDTASLMFYQFDESGNQIIDEETGEVEITGGGHPGAALKKRDKAKLQAKGAVAMEKGRSVISLAAQSVDGSYQFHDALSLVFRNSKTPGDLVKGLYDVFNKHCYDGVRRPKQIENARILHISNHRLHSHSKQKRESFATEINGIYRRNQMLFINLVEKFSIELDACARDRISTDSSGSSESSNKSDIDTYLKRLEIG